MNTIIVGSCVFMIVFASVLSYQINVNHKDDTWLSIYLWVSVVCFLINMCFGAIMFL